MLQCNSFDSLNILSVLRRLCQRLSECWVGERLGCDVFEEMYEHTPQIFSKNYIWPLFFLCSACEAIQAQNA